jgi:hypothetical protein
VQPGECEDTRDISSSAWTSRYLSDAADLAFVAVVNVLGRIVVEELAHVAKVARELGLALVIDADLPHRLHGWADDDNK